MDINCLKNKIPHRYPFLMIDKIVKTNKETYGVKNVSYNEWFFSQESKAPAIMPGTMILEAMAQTAGLIVFENNVSNEGKSVLLLAINKVKFRKKVNPGDILSIFCDTIWYRENTACVKTTAYVNKKKVAEAQVIIRNENGG